MTSTRRIALIAGVLFLVTFVASIAALILYAPVLHPARYLVGAGDDTRVRFGAVCELVLIIANIGTAVVLFPILKRQNETRANPTGSPGDGTRVRFGGRELVLIIANIGTAVVLFPILKRRFVIGRSSLAQASWSASATD